MGFFKKQISWGGWMCGNGPALHLAGHSLRLYRAVCRCSFRRDVAKGTADRANMELVILPKKLVMVEVKLVTVTKKLVTMAEKLVMTLMALLFIKPLSKRWMQNMKLAHYPIPVRSTWTPELINTSFRDCGDSEHSSVTSACMAGTFCGQLNPP